VVVCPPQALLELPGHIAPLLFSWPAGVVMGYHAARYMGAEAATTSASLVLLMQRLAEQGVTRVHVASHSM
jgi:esterase/lipase superfamily enzyme